MRFYIGSKQDCHLDTINGVNTLISNKSGKPYWGSSSNRTMLEDLKKDVFEASILASTGHRDELLSLEQFWIDKLNAVESLEFYNLSSAKLRGGMLHDKGTYANRYGETLTSFAGVQSAFMKRHNNALKLGFESFGHFVLDFIERRKDKTSMSIIEKHYQSISEEHFSVCRLKHLSQSYDLAKIEKQFSKVSEKDIELFREMVFQGASISKVSETTEFEIPVVSYYISDILAIDKKYLVAVRRNQTPEELELEVLKEVLGGLTIAQASRKLKITEASGNRYFYRILRERLKISDL